MRHLLVILLIAAMVALFTISEVLAAVLPILVVVTLVPPAERAASPT